MTFYEYMNNYELSDKIDEQMPESAGEDMGVIDYLFYDLSDDMRGDSHYAHVYGKPIKDVKCMAQKTIKKYDFKGENILNAFTIGFNDWKSFYKEVDELFEKILESNKVSVSSSL